MPLRSLGTKAPWEHLICFLTAVDEIFSAMAGGLRAGLIILQRSALQILYCILDQLYWRGANFTAAPAFLP
jgi:hypothetical protein